MALLLLVEQKNIRNATKRGLGEKPNWGNRQFSAPCISGVCLCIGMGIYVWACSKNVTKAFQSSISDLLQQLETSATRGDIYVVVIKIWEGYPHMHMKIYFIFIIYY